MSEEEELAYLKELNDWIKSIGPEKLKELFQKCYGEAIKKACETPNPLLEKARHKYMDCSYPVKFGVSVSQPGDKVPMYGDELRTKPDAS